MMCKGFCPCQIKHEEKQKQVHQRWNNFINKYKLTVDQKQNAGSPKITAVNTITSSGDKNLKFNPDENQKKNMADKFMRTVCFKLIAFSVSSGRGLGLVIALCVIDKPLAVSAA
uniref:Uncharacterized protein n=1 Tax=Strigamia maritima TaxID=126957 RepID=T1JGW2_STRMM